MKRLRKVKNLSFKSNLKLKKEPKRESLITWEQAQHSEDRLRQNWIHPAHLSTAMAKMILLMTMMITIVTIMMIMMTTMMTIIINTMMTMMKTMKISTMMTIMMTSMMTTMMTLIMTIMIVLIENSLCGICGRKRR